MKTTNENETIIICENCGSSWKIDKIANEIMAKLVDCPLCINKDLNKEKQ
ncbi:MAG TPA: hypothetical protein VI911_07490 [Patescibacteria group bacterium]|nr:hypothetical protein [Patescibacteria group bacterium]